MWQLIKLELKKHKISTYVIASIVISVIMLGMLYLLAYVANRENDPDMLVFIDYDNLAVLGSALNLAVFCTLSSVMASRFIIEAYSGKQANILFTYPISRTKILIAKIICVYVFTAITLFICNLFVFVVFGTTESNFHLMNSRFTVEIFTKIVEITFIISIIASMMGIVSMGIGFIKKSIPTTILSAVILSSVFCNLIFSTISNTTNNLISIIFMLVSITAGMITTAIIIKNVNRMEV